MTIRTRRVRDLVSHKSRAHHSPRMLPLGAVGREDGIRTEGQENGTLANTTNGPSVKVGREDGLDVLTVAGHDGPGAHGIDPVRAAVRQEHVVPALEEVRLGKGFLDLGEEVAAEDGIRVRVERRIEGAELASPSVPRVPAIRVQEDGEEDEEAAPERDSSIGHQALMGEALGELLACSQGYAAARQESRHEPPSFVGHDVGGVDRDAMLRR